ncbi:flavodoxin-like protein [Streptomyces gancidicus BKS 13-15]|uniref:Flavodoxin-like protein n=1 Tax=Streptomyces gancidicus BKS 13-15 TaxID=1284664 RepID=M3DIF8_STREZ|nr:flavodoxin domain-containing protein [Streptomyces gancidicus]EMF29725.1 flavodoxin-like protein [Streptomyces gancidicus BKS 13-15]
MNVLVGYATTHGSTRAIAERTAAALRHAGLAAEARPVTEVEDADAYRAFVLGSAVHGQSWLRPAKDFARNHLDVLVARPVWIFSVGMPAALRGPWRRMAPKELPVIEKDLPPGLVYRSHRLFSGVVERDQLPRTGRLLFRLVGGRFGDFRDWEAVDAWAAGIAGELRAGG